VTWAKTCFSDCPQREDVSSGKKEQSQATLSEKLTGRSIAKTRSEVYRERRTGDWEGLSRKVVDCEDETWTEDYQLNLVCRESVERTPERHQGPHNVKPFR